MNNIDILRDNLRKALELSKKESPHLTQMWESYLKDPKQMQQADFMLLAVVIKGLET